MGKALGGERCSVWNLLTSYVREPSTEYRASDGKKTFLDLGWEYISPDEDLRRRGGKTCFVFRELFINQMQKLNHGRMFNMLLNIYLKRKTEEYVKDLDTAAE